MVQLADVRRHLRVVVLAVAVVAVLVVFGSTCSAPDQRSLPPPSSTSTTVPEETTTSVDHSRTVLQPLTGRTTTTLAESGRAKLTGVVTGPAGPVAGATVRVERLVGDAVQVLEARTGDDGTWVLDRIPGGRMRVRAYAPPSLTMLEPEIFFLTVGEPRELRLTVREHQGIFVLSDVTPGSPTVGSNVNVAVRVLQRIVDDQGIARTQPLAGITLQAQFSGWTLLAGPAATAGDGVAVYTFRCEQAASVVMAVRLFDGVQEQTYPVDVPSCGARPTTTTSTSTTSTTEPDDSSSSTSSTSSTTEPEDE